MMIQDASRPMDKDRDGFVLGEGRSFDSKNMNMLLRGAIYCEIGGGGMSADAPHNRSTS
jgi:3-oxoacyl-[acyl-carrier-protein] synthase II